MTIPPPGSSQSASEKNDSLKRERLAEYGALREELVKRLGMRDQTLTATLVFAGVFLSLGVHKEISGLLPLVYPILCLFLAAIWAQNDVRIGQLGVYIKAKLETELPGLKWEDSIARFFRKNGGRNGILGWLETVRLAEFYSLGIFLGSQVVAGFIGVVRIWVSPATGLPRQELILAGVLLALDLLAMGLTCAIITQRRRLIQSWESRLGDPPSLP